MSLNWDVTKCDRSKVFEPAKADDPQNNIKQGEEILRAVTNRIIWATLGVDIGEITEKNWKEFYARVAFLQSIDGIKRDDARYISAQDVKDHIGLTTNVSDKKDAQWAARIYQSERSMTLLRIKNEEKKEEQHD